MQSGTTITITPFLTVKHAAKAISFYAEVFNGEVVEKHEMPNEKLMAKISVNGATFWMGDEEPEFDNVSPDTIGGTAVRMILVSPDPDTIFSRALQAGATAICPMTTEESWRIGKLKDPFGHIWEIGKPLDTGSDENGPV